MSTFFFYLGVKDKYHEQVEILENLIQDNTEKLSFMTVLEGEHVKLKKILRHTPESEVSAYHHFIFNTLFELIRKKMLIR